ncbi:alpha/beta-hydrolase [Fomitopsis serialis]|uniref:alpha/beta-hydrolase n=1 Tax=Fomitopsis serialis TaxID=139415 RepID=UPI002008ABA0|nr:alpha/beta-hydrolase [Neoantrodia serialis]KAH9925573.1 alpha/beta-hydrolase [Neoantrodia serialis]
MPHCAVDGDSTLLYYEDSGVPSGSTDYVTVFLVHGTMFSSAIFRPMMPYAAHHNLRLVLINCRDYPGSTLYSESELGSLSSTDPAIQSSALQARGLEFAEFIRRFIETQRIPPIIASRSGGGGGRRSGGFTLLGWSSGNCQTIPLLSYADLVPEATRKLLDAYFRSFVMYDISLPATGEAPVPGVWVPFRDDTLSPAEKFSQFSEWVSYYFTPTGFDASQDIDSPGIKEALGARIALHTDEKLRSSQRTPTVHRIGPEKIREVCHVEVMARSQKYYQVIDPAVYREIVRRAILQGSADGGMIWPNLKVALVWCDMTNSDVVSAAMKLKALVRQSRAKGEGRDVAFHKLERANHFAHWDEPERFTSLLAEVI